MDQKTNSKLERQADGTIKLTITLPSQIIKKAFAEEMARVKKNAEVPGFRKGKAPEDLLEKRVDKTKLNEEVLKQLIPKAYLEAVEEHKLRPIINPKIHIDPQNIQDQTDWQFTAETCEMPKAALGDYKTKIREVKAKSKIIVPGKEQKEVSFEEITKTLLDTLTAEIPKILLDQEVDKLLAQTLEEIKRLGISLDQYLTSTQRTPETLRKEYEQKAMSDLKLEIALAQVAEKEKITVEPKEIEEAIQKAKDPNEKQYLENNKYLLTGILRQQKTLDFLKSL